MSTLAPSAFESRENTHRSSLPGSLGGELLAGRLATGGLARGLLGACHFRVLWVRVLFLVCDQEVTMVGGDGGRGERWEGDEPRGLYTPTRGARHVTFNTGGQQYSRSLCDGLCPPPCPTAQAQEAT